MKIGCVFSALQDVNVVLLKTAIYEIVGLEIEQCASCFLWVYQTSHPPKKNHVSHRSTVILQ